MNSFQNHRTYFVKSSTVVVFFLVAILKVITHSGFSILNPISVMPSNFQSH